MGLTEIGQESFQNSFLRRLYMEINKNKYLRVVIDKREGKVSINDCTFASQKILELDALDEIMEGNFTLEVSSPGIERPLLKKEDYDRFKGNKVKIITKDNIKNTKIFIGQLQGMDGENIVLKCGNKEYRIDFANVKKANLEVDIF
ncbi:MAG: ribosome maturation factor RimP [Nitrososphaeria archaeon]